MKKLLTSFSGILILLLVSTLAGYADNKLSITRSATNTLEVQLSNSEEIYGVQFSLRTSSDIVLGKLERDFLTTEEHWLVASYKPNDSVVNVIIINTQSKYFSSGDGALAKITFTSEKPNVISSALLANVMITNKNADSLGVAINNLDWNNKSVLIANNTESKSFAFGQNFPNPFNPSTKIAYRLNKPAQVRLSVYDITGREVNRLVDRYQSVGDYNISWNSNDDNGQKMASGMYFARLNVDNESVTRKMVMTK
jgi:FlgD Ig-like domain